VYLLLYIHQGNLSFLGIDQTAADDSQIALAKINSTAESICREKISGKFFNFVERVYALRFDESPNYEEI
jgi:hypothetical protein